ncbi:MAG TPA: hypothetical protein VF824_12945 [Thermoanaerobaculia bacterium]|jgi:hypothetical protein
MRHEIIPAREVHSLAWIGDALVDVVSGFARYLPDVAPGRFRWPFPFDAAVTANEYAVIYQRLGTKALLLRDGELLRELNRSYYYADRYEYPVCLVAHGGRTLLIHCPDFFDRLEIEDAATGERLTTRDSKRSGVFHSRLAANPRGDRFLSAGWVWQPLDLVDFFSLDEALRDPRHLDRGDSAPGSGHVGWAEESAACWLTDTRLVVTSSDDEKTTTKRRRRHGSCRAA